MTDEKLEELTKLSDAADGGLGDYPGFWDADDHAVSAADVCSFVGIYDTDSHAAIARIVRHKQMSKYRTEEEAVANAKFIVACVNYVRSQIEEKRHAK